MQPPSLPVLAVLSALVSGQLSLANRVTTTWRDLNEAASLYCEEPCSGVETWEKTGVTVAECGRNGGDGFSCERRADGSTLTIPKVNYTTRGFYQTFCDGHQICFQNLQPNPHRSSAEAPAEGLLILDLFTLQPVSVTFSGTDGGSGTPVQMCTVEGRSLQCNPEYRDRVSVFGNSVVLRGVGQADSGVYTVREVYDGAALVRTVSVTVGGRTERSPDSEATREKLQQVTLILTGSKNGAVQPCDGVLTALLVVFCFVAAFLGVVLTRECRKNRPGCGEYGF